MGESIPFSLGIKMWSANTDLLPKIFELYSRDFFDYVELYVVPGTSETISEWRPCPWSYSIHCPHSTHGFNVAKSDLRESNARLFEEVKLFAEELAASSIVVHPGNDGPYEESIHQLRALEDGRIFLENKPHVGAEGQVCRGATPEEMKLLLRETGAEGLVLDFGHALYAANALGRPHSELVEGFLELNPGIFHLNDGPRNAVRDVHENLGKGSFDLSYLVGCIPEGTAVTLETPRSSEEGFSDLVSDVMYLRAMMEC